MTQKGKAMLEADVRQLEKNLIAEAQECGRLRAEVAKLEALGQEYDEEFNRIKAERDAGQRKADAMHAAWKQAEAKASAAFVRGLERARQIADDIELMSVDYGIETAIRAEIDKAKAGK